MSVEVATLITAVAGLAPLVREIVDSFRTIRGREKLNKQDMDTLEQQMHSVKEALGKMGRLGSVLDRYREFHNKTTRTYSMAKSFYKNFPEWGEAKDLYCKTAQEFLHSAEARIYPREEV